MIGQRSAKRLACDWKNGQLQMFREEVDKQVRSQEWSTRQDVADFYYLICTTILNVAKTCVGLKAVGMNGDRWKTKEKSELEMLRDTTRTRKGIHSDSYQAIDQTLKYQVQKRKRDLCKKSIRIEKQKDDVDGPQESHETRNS